jgi:hypothetical protein
VIARVGILPQALGRDLGEDSLVNLLLVGGGLSLVAAAGRRWLKASRDRLMKLWRCGPWRRIPRRRLCLPPGRRRVGVHTGLSPVGQWELHPADDDLVRCWFRDGLFEDLVLVLTLAGTTPAWP